MLISKSLCIVDEVFKLIVVRNVSISTNPVNAAAYEFISCKWELIVVSVALS